MLIIEIILTVFAWRKGWKWWALLPIAAAFIIGLFLGAGVGASGGDIEAVTGLGIVLDVIAIIVLIFMVAKAPKGVEEVKETKDIENA